jgi:hypothetical protein
MQHITPEGARPYIRVRYRVPYVRLLERASRNGFRVRPSWLASG